MPQSSVMEPIKPRMFMAIQLDPNFKHVTLKDKDPIVPKSKLIYQYKCGQAGCEEEYIGELRSIFGTGLGNTSGSKWGHLAT